MCVKILFGYSKIGTIKGLFNFADTNLIFLCKRPFFRRIIKCDLLPLSSSSEFTCWEACSKDQGNQETYRYWQYVNMKHEKRTQLLNFTS